MEKKQAKKMKKTAGNITDVRVKVVYKRGFCVFGHEVGDEWIVGGTTRYGFCPMAYHAIYPNIRLLQRGGYYNYPAGSGVIRSSCTDAWNLVVFELSQVPRTGHTNPPLPGTCGYIEYL